MGKNTVRYGFFAAIVVLIVNLTGVFGTFAGREVIADGLQFDTVILLLMFAVSAYVIGVQLKNMSPVQIVLNTTVASAIVGITMSALVIFESQIDLYWFKFIFQNYYDLEGSVVTFGYSGDQLIFPGLTLLMLTSVIIGVVMGIAVQLSRRVQNTIYLTLTLTIVIGLMENQVNDIMTLPDALVISAAFVAGYIELLFVKVKPIYLRFGFGFIPGAFIGGIVGWMVQNGTFPAYTGDLPYLLQTVNNPLITLVLIFGVISGIAGVIASGKKYYSQGAFYGLAGILALGILNSRGEMDAITAILLTIIFAIALWFAPEIGTFSQARFSRLTLPAQKWTSRVSVIGTMAVVLIAPVFLGQYITNVLDLVMLYIIMGIGLNVMVGFAGLLDLGYVASFAIGAYTLALVTTPSFFTTGCSPEAVAEGYRYIEMCTDAVSNWHGVGILSFWMGVPIAVIVSAITGMALGLPVMGLRGDYLAIVTLGFGQITSIMIRANDLKVIFGSAQGISPIPVPTIDLSFINPNWVIEFNNATSIYYLYLAGAFIAAFVVIKLAGARLGRAWRAIKADEDVAEAAGIHLVYNKLLAFGISSAFAGLGGAIFAVALRGIFPDSFTVFLSINVLSLIIIGGLGSIPGVVLGAMMLIGLPEVLRELEDYRLLTFGSLLVVAMILKPDGFLPPPVRKLSEMVPGRKTKDAEVS